MSATILSAPIEQGDDEFNPSFIRITMATTRKDMACLDQYWRLFPERKLGVGSMNDILRYKDYHIKNEYRRAEVTEIMLRYECGHLCYDKCSDEELADFIQRRRIIEGGFSLTYEMAFHLLKRQRMLEVLIQADGQRTFSRFLELPPDLRSRVYEYYFGAFNRRLRTPAQPPLARTCRLMRTEALPAFYSRTTFLINGSRNAYRQDPIEKQAQWLDTMPAHAAAAIRNLYFSQWKINVDTRNAAAKADELSREADQNTCEARKAVLRTEAAINNVFRDIGTGEGKRKLEVEDIRAVRDLWMVKL